MVYENNNEDIKRKLPELEHIDESDVKDIILKNELTLLENELSLLDEKKLGFNLDELNESDVSFVFNFVDKDTVNPYTEKKTKNDLLNSYIMTFDNYESISKSIWEITYVNNGTDDKPKFDKKITIKDFPLYRKWKIRASKYWADKKLDDYVVNMKTLFEGKVERSEILKEAIFNDAIDENVSEKVKLDSRKQMIDILGLKKERANNSINIFHQGGGSDLVNSLKDMSNMEVEVVDMEIDEVDYDE